MPRRPPKPARGLPWSPVRWRWKRRPESTRIDVETAEQMAEAVFAALPADAAILVAAVADWRVEPSATKLKKSDGPPQLNFVPTRDILAELGASEQRPRLLIGFAAETERVVEQAIAKRTAKARRLDRRQ